MNTQHEDFEWFVENYKTFQEVYGDTYLVIKNKQVVNTYDNYGTAVRETMKTEMLGSFIVQKCCRNDLAYCCCVNSCFK